jgi:hypothetical protein
MYAAERCKTPLFKHEDKKWHVDYVENGKWTEKTFPNHDDAYKLYLEIFYKLEAEYKTTEEKMR